jgi:hypothetical protein
MALTHQADRVLLHGALGTKVKASCRDCGYRYSTESGDQAEAEAAYAAAWVKHRQDPDAWRPRSQHEASVWGRLSGGLLALVMSGLLLWGAWFPRPDVPPRSGRVATGTYGEVHRL